jgi:sigma-E factor negative regulatory protein RseC
MIEQYARVETQDAQHIRLRAETQTTSCQTCHSGKGCGVSLLSQLFPRRFSQQLQLPLAAMPQAVKAGDRVLLGIHEGCLYRAAILLYVLPLLGLIGGGTAGIWISQLMNNPMMAEPISIVTGLSGLSIGVAYARYRATAHADALQRHVQVLQVMPTVQAAVISRFSPAKLAQHL